MFRFKKVQKRGWFAIHHVIGKIDSHILGKRQGVTAQTYRRCIDNHLNIVGQIRQT